MPIRVGIPRALFYYYYFPQWKKFFENLGAEVVVSPQTNKKIMDDGVRAAVDEACLPVKIYYGHVINLRDRVDLIFTPRLISMERRAFICPKFMGLPDMIKSGIGDLPGIIDTTFDMSRRDSALKDSVLDVGQHFTSDKRRIMEAWQDASVYYDGYIYLTENGFLPVEAMDIQDDPKNVNHSEDRGLVIAVLGHGYNIYDDFISMNLIKKLRSMGCSVVTPDTIPHTVSENEAAALPKRMFWSLGKRIIGAALHFAGREDINGFIYLQAFGCGPDSMIADLTERYVRRRRKVPFQTLTMDEHTGEAGIQTRIEAFVDMIEWRGIS